MCKEQGEQDLFPWGSRKEVKVLEDWSENKTQYVPCYTDLLIQVLCFAAIALNQRLGSEL